MSWWAFIKLWKHVGNLLPIVETRALRRRHWSAAARQINFGRRRPVQKIGGGEVLAAKKCFKGSQKNFVLSSKSSVDDLFLVIDRKLQKNKYTTKMASAARRQIIGGGGGGASINKSRRRRQQIVGGAARPAQGSSRNIVTSPKKFGDVRLDSSAGSLKISKNYFLFKFFLHFIEEKK